MHPADRRLQPRRAPILSHLVTVLTLSGTCLQPSRLPAQTAAPTSETPQLAATYAEAIRTRDAFVARVHAAGFTCPISPPPITVERVPSYGQYDEEKNTLSTSDWTVLSPESRANFLRLAGPNATEADAHALFDLATHRWILIHELGHWWQACNEVTAGKDPYRLEYNADRVSLAYWREVDPTVVTRMMPVFRQVVATFPDPTPPGQQTIAYFNAHYQELGPTPAYRWYQSEMNAAADDERPIPTFAQILSTIKQAK